jgi:MGT family glycosyltransferase
MAGNGRFLFATWDGGGNVPPTLTIARGLVERGHSVRVLGPEALRAVTEATGSRLVPYERVPMRDLPRAARAPALARVRAALFALELARADPVLAYAEELLSELERAPADVLVVDFMLAGGLAAAERAGLPTAALMHTVYCLPAPGLPPFGPGFRPARNASGMLRDAAVSALVRPVKRRRLNDLNEARRRMGLDAVGSASDQLARIARVLVLTSEAFDFRARSLPSNVRYVGPQLGDPPPAEPIGLPLSTRRSEPLVVVSFGTRFAPANTVQHVLDALGELPVRGLLTLGPALSPEDVRAPGNVELCEFVPHGAVLPHAALVITHAGLGTTMAALANGVPLLCVPIKNDQFENAARVVAAGAGLRVSRSAYGRRLGGAILELLSKPGFKAAAERLANVLADGTARAVEELEALAGEHEPAAASHDPRSSSITRADSRWRRTSRVLS